MKARFVVNLDQEADVALDAEAIDILIDATEKRINMAAVGGRYEDIRELLGTRDQLVEALSHLTSDKPQETAEA